MKNSSLLSPRHFGSMPPFFDTSNASPVAGVGKTTMSPPATEPNDLENLNSSGPSEREEPHRRPPATDGPRLRGFHELDLEGGLAVELDYGGSLRAAKMRHLSRDVQECAGFVGDELRVVGLLAHAEQEGA